MSDYKVVPVEPIRRAMDALERFANDTLAGRNSAHELRELLAAAPAVQGEPVGWQFYMDGEWWNGDDRIKDHRKITEELRFRVRDVYAAPQPAVQGEPVACEVVGRAYHESFGSGVRLKLYIDAHQWPIAEAIPIGTKLYFSPQPAPDVSALVEALEASTHRIHEQVDGEDDCRCSQCHFVRLRDAALAAYRQEEEK